MCKDTNKWTNKQLFPFFFFKQLKITDGAGIDSAGVLLGLPVIVDADEQQMSKAYCVQVIFLLIAIFIFFYTFLHFTNKYLIIRCLFYV